MRLVASLAGAVLLMAACGGISAEPNDGDDRVRSVEDSTTSTTTAAIVPATSAPANSSTTTLSPGPRTPAEVDLAAYIAVIERLVIGTVYEGMALESPHVFLATGALFCEQLDDGASSDDVLYEYIETLTGGPPDDASDDALTMAGAVLGSGLVTLCPHHIATIGISE